MTRPGKYPPEVRERAARMVLEYRRDYPSQWAAISSIAMKCGMTAETLRTWVHQAEVDSGGRPGLTTDERGATPEAGAREQRVAPCQRDPQGRIGFFARELDPGPPR